MEGTSKDFCDTGGQQNEHLDRSNQRSRTETTTFSSGTPGFVEELRSKHFPSANEVILTMTGQQLTLPFLQHAGFTNPILVPQKEGLGITIPPDTFSVSDVEQYLGSNRRVHVIEVARQSEVPMKLGQFIRHFKNPKRTKVLNLLSLEISSTPLSSLVEAPYIARKLDWLNHVWPTDVGEDKTLTRPQVEKYCLLSTKDSYTDFHIDFGGSSVWYHLLWGEKTFFLIKPTCANLSLYQRWTSSCTQSETFFGDQVDMCYKFTLKKGQTLLIPSGWIHAVLTPVDSLVFGGNFLHSLNIQLQLQVHEIEVSMKLAKKFLYPSFHKVNWFAARSLLGDLKRVNNSGKKVPLYLLSGLKALLLALKQWNQDKDMKKGVKNQIPKDIKPNDLIEDIRKEILVGEIFAVSLNLPHPVADSAGQNSIQEVQLLMEQQTTPSFDETEYSDQVLEYSGSNDLHEVCIEENPVEDSILNNANTAKQRDENDIQTLMGQKTNTATDETQHSEQALQCYEWNDLHEDSIEEIPVANGFLSEAAEANHGDKNGIESFNGQKTKAVIDEKIAAMDEPMYPEEAIECCEWNDLNGDRIEEIPVEEGILSKAAKASHGDKNGRKKIAANDETQLSEQALECYEWNDLYEEIPAEDGILSNASKWHEDSIEEIPVANGIMNEAAEANHGDKNGIESFNGQKTKAVIDEKIAAMDETQYPEEAVECCEWNDVHKDGNDETPIAMERSKSLAKLGPSQVGDINLPKSSENVRKSMRMKRKLILEDYIYPLKSRKGCVVRKDGNDKIPIAVERSKSLAKLGPSQVGDINLLKSSENVRKSMRMKRKLILEDYIYPLKSRKGCMDGKRTIENDRERHEEPEKMNCSAERDSNPAQLADNEKRQETIPGADETEDSELGTGFKGFDIGYDNDINGILSHFEMLKRQYEVEKHEVNILKSMLSLCKSNWIKWKPMQDGFMYIF